MRGTWLTAVLALAAVSCRAEPDTFHWRVGEPHRLMLYASGPRQVLTAERAERLAPISDTCVVVLVPQVASADSVTGTFTADVRHFWVAFMPLDSTFVAVREEGRWLISLGPHVVDAGMALNGSTDGEGVRGTWITRDSRGDTGTFTLRVGA